MFDEKNYTVARGELHFHAFVDGTRTLDGAGERYIGNTPEIALTTDTEVLDHYDADHGLREKDDSVILEKNTSGTFTADDIQMDNLAMLFLGTAGTVLQVAATAQTQDFVGVLKGRSVQLGVTPANPVGVRGVANVTVVADTTPLVVNVDYIVEADTGRIIFLRDGTVLTDAPDDEVTVTYDVTATDYLQMISGDRIIQGQLRYVAYNTKGEKIDHLFPMVNIRPDGDYSLGGDDWQIMSFAFDALKKNSNTAVLYANGRPGRGIL